MIEKKLRKEIQRVLGAFIFYTRIPFPSKWYSAEKINSSRYFSLVGCIIGLVSASVFVIPEIFVTNYHSVKSFETSPILVLLGMVVAVLFTGAMHEDGFADSCDGILGGWNKEERLKIMKDSRIGTYGSVGLVFLILIKFYALLQIDPRILPLVWIAGHALSRFISISQVFFAEYVQNSVNSKSKSMIELSVKDLTVNSIFGLLPLFFIGNISWLVLIINLLIGLVLLFYFKKRLGGVTGDSLGATQQIVEVSFYLSFGLNVII
tara:strand:+ start:272 stop:1063 length:792 start_codon:yes stop_codon:yes gene_type:complete